MAVYQGARTRPFGVSPRPSRLDAPALPRRRLRGAVRARRGPSRPAVALGAIVLTFMLAFFSLAQTVRVSATSYDIDGLSVERELIESRRLDVVSDLNRLGKEPAIRKLSIDAGLGVLADPVILPAR